MTEAQIAAVAGEHYVAHRIATLGFIPTIVRQQTPRVDLLATSANGEKTVAIQVKSSFNAMHDPSPSKNEQTFDLKFPLGHRAVTSTAGTGVFCFVDLRRMTTAIPDVYVVPASVLKREYEGVYLRKYSQLHYQRPWQAMQPFRNNWDPLIRAVSGGEPGEPAARVIRAMQTDGAAARWRSGLVLMDQEHWPSPKAI